MVGVGTVIAPKPARRSVAAIIWQRTTLIPDCAKRYSDVTHRHTTAGETRQLDVAVGDWYLGVDGDHIFDRTDLRARSEITNPSLLEL